MNAFTQDKRYGDMLAIIIFLFMLDEYDERKLFFDKITFCDRALESRLKRLWVLIKIVCLLTNLMPCGIFPTNYYRILLDKRVRICYFSPRFA